MELTENVLEIRDLVKDFPGVRAVNNVSFDIKRNTVHCLVGENGAGKSTLIKILTGATIEDGRQDPAERGRVLARTIPKEAKQKGISTLFQELNVVDQLTVEENLTLGMEDTTFGFLRKTDKINKMVSVMNSLEPSISPRQLVSTLSVAKKQIVEIAKAVATRVRHHHHGRADGGHLRKRNCPTFQDRQGPAGEERHRHLHLPPARRDIRARRLRDGHARRQAHRHEARRRRSRTGPSSSG